jgi:hypothetical protein
MNRPLFLALLVLTSTAALPAQTRIYQQGTVTRMRMAPCMAAQHPILAALSGVQAQPAAELCPEYTMKAEKVVYILVGKTRDQLIPLAEIIEFRLDKKELAVRVDDEKRETRFLIREMALRPDWERDELRRRHQMFVAAQQRTALDD